MEVVVGVRLGGHRTLQCAHRIFADAHPKV